MKRKYIKPQANGNNTIEGIAPALAVGAALAGGYVIGRVVKQIEARPDELPMRRSMRRVVIDG